MCGYSSMCVCLCVCACVLMWVHVCPQSTPWVLWGGRCTLLYDSRFPVHCFHQSFIFFITMTRFHLINIILAKKYPCQNTAVPSANLLCYLTMNFCCENQSVHSLKMNSLMEQPGGLCQERGESKDGGERRKISAALN